MAMQRKDPDERHREPRYIHPNNRRSDVERGLFISSSREQTKEFRSRAASG
jgi:hypothetical protein